MFINKSSVTIMLAAGAMAISTYNLVIITKLTANDTNVVQKSQSMSTNTSTDDKLIYQLQQNVTQLQQQVMVLKKQLPTVSDDTSNQATIKQLVLAVIAEKEQQVQAKMRASNPYHAFYSELPDDYELRIKSDPQYAQKMATQLREQILNPNISDTERLVALNQLQLNMNILNKQSMPEYDFAVIDSLFNLAINSTDGNFKIQAIEAVTQTPVLDYRVVEKFTQLLATDNNDYVRRLAVQGLVMQYYQAQNEQTGYSQQVAQHLLSLYKNPTDNDVKTLLDEIFGNQKMLDELQNHATGGS
ncbi:MAG: HEAT repeat domain-containing protein [Pseudoalteromonas prydzensis]|uniref:HEAT repeat domain-containing protein n=1 Tax=Pseudoalteromonas prydzensis TaxID=182141 RepID=UPI003F97BB0D